jgi:hypothetical protein
MSKVTLPSSGETLVHETKPEDLFRNACSKETLHYSNASSEGPVFSLGHRSIQPGKQNPP